MCARRWPGRSSATTLPPFTCSFGIAHSTVGHDGDTVLRVADAGLLQAKDLGGDQAVVADADLVATIFADDAPLAGPSRRAALTDGGSVERAGVSCRWCSSATAPTAG